MTRTNNGKVELEYEVFGADRAGTILLINGLGSQMTRWPKAFCDRLVARGYRAIRFDNRDVGLSSSLVGESYTLSDMAADAIAVLEAVGASRAHLAGISMGGMIAQRVAIAYPGRVLSLTSIMSASGAPGSLESTPEAAAVLNNPPPDPAADFEAFVEAMVRNARTIGSPAYPWDEGALRDRAIAEYRRAFNPAGTARQRRAIFADGDRTPELRNLTIPTVVLHGAEDPLVKPRGGELTAEAIPGAELRIVPGMGHDLPPSLYDTVVDAICAAAERVER